MPVTITWSLKGQELNSGPSITTTTLGQRASMLVISSVDYTHIGEYTCRATNSAGSVTYSVDLNVNGNQTLVTWEGTGYILRFLTCIFSIRTTKDCPGSRLDSLGLCRMQLPLSTVTTSDKTGKPPTADGRAKSFAAKPPSSAKRCCT